MPVEPKIASTVILLRERVPDLESDDDCEFEVFMAKRHENSRFMSEHHVFPGGSIEEQDVTNESNERLVGIEEDVLENLKEVCEDPSNLWVIAIRELFEEAGILIATNKTGDSRGKIEEKPKKLKKYQRKLQKKRMTMTKVLTKENLYYSASDLRYFGRLITPKLSPIRYDTQFFICKFPKNQNIHLFSDELTESLWGSPKQLLKLFKKREIKLIFPQYSSLQRLQKFKTIQEVLDNSKNVSSHNRLIE
ncbi:MAG: NUDIX hydrolase [Promethearchaeota archaeon]|jgi:8-oxo-dGTP pyrophosphatase MutT (NUDIX family)